MWYSFVSSLTWSHDSISCARRPKCDWTPVFCPPCLRRERREEVGPCDHVSHEERQIYQTSIPWCLISFASLRGRELELRKNLFHFLLMKTTCFITRHRGADGGTGSGIETSVRLQITDFWSFQFGRVLTEADGACETRRPRAPCVSPAAAAAFNFIKMHIYRSVLWWYDWMYWRWLTLSQ